MPELRIPPNACWRRCSSATRVAVITGAGMSAESGVPTFRGAGGLWRSFRPEDLATPQAFARDPQTVWAWYRWRQRLIAEAVAECRPRRRLRAHQIARQDGECSRRTSMACISGQAATAVLELHGSIWRTRCASCGQTPRAPIEAGADAEDMHRCRGASAAALDAAGCRLVRRSHWTPTGARATAWTIVEEAETVIVVGTSAVVYPGRRAAAVAARARNVPLIEINVEDTPLTASVTHVVRATAATALAALRVAVVKRLAPADRPREKLARAGAAALGDNELIAVILGQGGAGRTALDLGAAILACAGGPTGLSRLSLADLQRVDGVGIARAAQILAAVELGRRTLSATLERRQFTKPREWRRGCCRSSAARRSSSSGRCCSTRSCDSSA